MKNTSHDSMKSALTTETSFDLFQSKSGRLFWNIEAYNEGKTWRLIFCLSLQGSEKKLWNVLEILAKFAKIW
jgi:hypothetical protein